MALFGKKYECKICGSKFKTEKDLLEDMERHKKGIFRCESCNEDFADEGSMKMHRARDHRI
jgi:ribosomal protein L37AE/L43A